LQQGASELVGASIDINNHLVFGLSQGQNWWCKKRFPQVVEGRKGCVSWRWETSARVIALSGFARLASL